LIPEDETLEEQLAIVQQMRKRNPKLVFNICPECKTWAVMLKGFKGLHPLCYEKRQNNTVG
jgi:hypothetical protein